MYLLIPGRHHVLTQFQFDYLQGLVQKELFEAKDVFGKSLGGKESVEAIIFAVTSANHSNTRRNPLPFYLRAIAIEALGNGLGVPVYTYGVDDVGDLSNFASYTLKRIGHESEGRFDLKPSNCLLVCSTPVMDMYLDLGFTVLPAELESKQHWTYKTLMPWDIVITIAGAKQNWWQDKQTVRNMHPASFNIWKKYSLGEKVQMLFKDHMISNDGDLTETRDYNLYVRQMDEIAALKYNDTATYIQPGRIGDIGCAVGSWIKMACADERFRESDFYGIEVSRHLFEICKQRKENGEFANPFVFFSQRNAVTGLVYERNSMHSIHTSSLTHEIESYGSRADLLHFIKNRYAELAPGGVWINRDVVGPYNKDKTIYLWLNTEDGKNEGIMDAFEAREDLSKHLQSLSTYARFIRFSYDFIPVQPFVYYEERIDLKVYVKVSLRLATEFLSRKDYCDNWQSEMHETFCYWDFDEWKQHLIEEGFSIHPASSVFRNEWIVKNRWEGKVALFEGEIENLAAIGFPVTTMILIGVKEA